MYFNYGVNTNGKWFCIPVKYNKSLILTCNAFWPNYFYVIDTILTKSKIRQDFYVFVQSSMSKIISQHIVSIFIRTF